MFRWRPQKRKSNARDDSASAIEMPPTVASAKRRDTSETRRAAQIDLVAGIGEATERDIALGQVLRNAFSLTHEMAAFSSEFSDMAETTLMRADQFVASVCNLQSQSDFIEERLVTAAHVVNEAQTRACSALTSVKELTAVIGEIERVAGMIASIAAQTNMLALNATIEAARAGTAGAGFRIVAGEVKLLSGQTEEATQNIVGFVERIRSRAKANMTEVKAFDHVVGSLQEVFTTVRAAIELQGQQTRDIGVGSEEVAQLAQKVKMNAGRLEELGGTVRNLTQAAEASADQARIASMHLNDQAAIVLGHGDADEGHSNLRWPVVLSGTASLGGCDYAVRVIDLSANAMQIEVASDFPPCALGEVLAVYIAGIGEITLRLLSPTPAGYETALIKPAWEVTDRVVSKVDALRIAYHPYIVRIQDVAGRAGKLIENAIAEGNLSMDALFDSNYRCVGDANPPQYTTPAVKSLEAATQALLESELLRRPAPDFCMLQDRNGFNAVHNLRYSNARRDGDLAWNLRHSRMHRIFNDKVGMAASRNLRSFLVQSYARDMGDAIETRMEFDAPVFVDERHWGVVRMAYQLIEEAKL